MMLFSFGLVYFSHKHPLSFVNLHLSFFIKVELKGSEKAYIIFCIWLVILEKLQQLSSLNSFLFYLLDFFKLLPKIFSGLGLEFFICLQKFFDFLLPFLSFVLQFLAHFFFAEDELVVNFSAKSVA